jgi:PAS domain-containing protein
MDIKKISTGLILTEKELASQRKAATAINMSAIVEYRAGKKDDAYTKYLAAIVQSSDDAIISKSLDGIITCWNKGSERMFGYTADEAVGKPVSILIPPQFLSESSHKQ